MHTTEHDEDTLPSRIPSTMAQLLQEKNWSPTEDKSSSEWNQIVKAFEEKINAERKEAGYPPMKRGQLLAKIKKVKQNENISSYWDWWIFYRKCEDADMPFGALFFWKAKK